MDEREATARRYGEHLTGSDLLALAGGRPEQAAALRREPTLILDLLDRPAVTDRLLRAGPGGPGRAVPGGPGVAATQDSPGRFTYISPFLVFAAAIHRTTGDLVGRAYVAERTGARTRVPVFDGPALAAFGAVPDHRLYLAELLASYSRVASGVVARRTERGWRRQRWDELDLPRLAGLLDAVPAGDRPAVWRRLGDGAIFLAGIFPEHADRMLGPVALARLARATGLALVPGEGAAGRDGDVGDGGGDDRPGRGPGLSPGERDRPDGWDLIELAGRLASPDRGRAAGAGAASGAGGAGGVAGDTVALLENLARRAYARVGPGVPAGAARSPSSARRLLTLIRDRYLFPLATDWLPAPGR